MSGNTISISNAWKALLGEIRQLFDWLGVAVTRKQREKQEEEREQELAEKRKRNKDPRSKSGDPSRGTGGAKVTISIGDESASFELGSSGGGGGGGGGGDDDGDKPEKKSAGASGTGALVLKVAGAIAAGIGVIGAVTAVGGSVLWVRFGEAGLPATQAVTVIPKDQLLVQGAQQVIVFALVALAAVVFIGMFDPKGYVTRGTAIGFGLLVLGSWGYVVCTDLGCGAALALMALALLLAGGCVRIAISTDDRFWPMAVSVFLATLVFSSICGYLVVKQQDSMQAIAILRSPTDKGLTGVFVTATEKTIYLGQPLTVGDGSEQIGPDLYEVPNSEKVSYAVGPLQSREEAAARANSMLAQLIENRSQDPTPPSPTPEEKKGAGTPGEENGATTPSDAAEVGSDKTGTTAAVASAGGVSSTSVSLPAPDVFDAFAGRIIVRRKIGTGPLCMVRYSNRTVEDLSGHWWTSCANANRFEAILDAKDNLALPARFQAVYDMRVEASVPAETAFTYLMGRTAPQCEHDPPLACGYRFPGGGIQYYLPKPSTALPWIRERKCTDARQDAPSDWGPC